MTQKQIPIEEEHKYQYFHVINYTRASQLFIALNKHISYLMDVGSATRAIVRWGVNTKKIIERDNIVIDVGIFTPQVEYYILDAVDLKYEFLLN